MSKGNSGQLNRILLIYMLGAPLAAAAFAFILKLLGWPPEAAVFLAPTILGCILIERAYHAGMGTGQAPTNTARSPENARRTGADLI